MIIWLLMVGLFFGIHTVIWRYKPALQNKKMLLMIGALVFLSVGLFKVTLLQFIHISLAYFSVVLSYVIFYLWLEGNSPTLHFIELLSQQGEAPVSLNTLKSHFSENNPITGRLAILVEEGFCVHEPPNYRLTQRGIWVAHLCSCIANTFNIALEG